MEPHSGEKRNWRSQIRTGYENTEAADKGACPCQVGMVPLPDLPHPVAPYRDTGTNRPTGPDVGMELLLSYLALPVGRKAMGHGAALHCKHSGHAQGATRAAIGAACVREVCSSLELSRILPSCKTVLTLGHNRISEMSLSHSPVFTVLLKP